MCHHLLKNWLAKDAASLHCQGPDSESLELSSPSIFEIGLKEQMEKDGNQKSLFLLGLTSRLIIECKNGLSAFPPTSD